VLGDFPLNPILPAADGARAEDFHRDVLGLHQVSPPGVDPMLFEAGDGTKIVLTELPDRKPPDYPMISFTVSGIEGLVEELERRGVDLLVPEPSSFRGVRGEVSGFITDYGPVKSGMFSDSEGNVLAINEIGDL
jgi:catechol 2,3-dioxygenase-like lactoylglutathione lyase family enzyme